MKNSLSKVFLNKYTFGALIVVLLFAVLLPPQTFAPPTVAQAPQPSPTPSMPSTRVVIEAQELVHRRVASFRQHVSSTLTPELKRVLNDYFARSRRGVDTFLDEQFAILTQLKASWNMVCDTSNWLWEKGNALFGRRVAEAPNRNAQMARTMFETYVLSEASLQATIARAGEIAESELQRLTMDFIVATNRDLSEILSRELRIEVPPERVAAAFQEVAKVAVQTMHPEQQLLHLIMTTAVSNAVFTQMTPILTGQIATFLTSVWYAQLTTMGKIGVWLGLETVPASIGIGAGVAGGAATMGLSILAAVAVSWIIEGWTRPEARAKIISALDSLEHGLVHGDFSTPGLVTMLERSVNDLCATMEDVYLRAIQRIVN
ncbi:MAG: hypothetical protein OZSIB_1601 [Candidatus Ozemobacter sibiricus]|uniref:Uncharacterized protein n=1 Tax=Candidatus Ozemobacter sibiricus TaxID=2268124 RepID=A0A367ZJB4_9BACT|nr:MAG: hypothetical protein OZSIB_1601 [Candidatus Ozemobacter sibiricus]